MTPSPRLEFRRAFLVVASALLVLFCRRPDAFLNPQLWAEDFVFLATAEKLGFAAFWVPQAGYFQLIPRMIAWLAVPLDPALQPGFYEAGWLVVALAVVFACLSSRHDLPLKPWLAAVVLIVPHSGEVFLNPTNAQWVAALGILLTTIKRDPARLREWIADIGVLFFAGLSGPFIIFSVPLFAIRAVRRRSAASRAFLGMSAALAAAQLWLAIDTPTIREFVGPFSLLGLLANISFRLPCNVFFGVLATEGMGRPAAVALGLAVMGFLGFAAWRGGKNRGAMEFFLIFLLFPLVATAIRKRFDLWGFGVLAAGDRYFYIPKVVLLWVAGVIFASQQIRWVRWTAFALMVCSMASNAPRFRFPPFADNHWYSKCPDIRAGRRVELTINPGWRFTYRRGSGEYEGPL